MIRPSRDPLHQDQRLTEVEDMVSQLHLRLIGRDNILSQALAAADGLSGEKQKEMFAQLPGIYDEMDRKIAEDYRKALAKYQEEGR